MKIKTIDKMKYLSIFNFHKFYFNSMRALQLFEI